MLRAVSRPRARFRSSLSVVLNRLDEPNAMALTRASEKVNKGLKHVSGHNSAQRAFQKLSFDDSESSLRALRDGAYGAFRNSKIRPQTRFGPQLHSESVSEAFVESSLRALRNGANGAFGAVFVKPSERNMCRGRLSSASFALANHILIKYYFELHPLTKIHPNTYRFATKRGALGPARGQSIC